LFPKPDSERGAVFRFDEHRKQRAFAHANDKSQALGEEQIRVPIAEARSRMDAFDRTLGVKIFEKLASASDSEQLGEFLLALPGAKSALLGFVERRELCCALLEHRFVGDLVAPIDRFRAVPDHRHSRRARDTRPFEIANRGPAKIVGHLSYYARPPASQRPSFPEVLYRLPVMME